MCGQCTRVQGHPRNLFQRPPPPPPALTMGFQAFVAIAPNLTIPRQRILVYGGKLLSSNAAGNIPKETACKNHCTHSSAPRHVSVPGYRNFSDCYTCILSFLVANKKWPASSQRFRGCGLCMELFDSSLEVTIFFDKLYTLWSAEALGILCAGCETERERETRGVRDRERERETWPTEKQLEWDGSGVTIVALKLAMRFTLSFAENLHSPFGPCQMVATHTFLLQKTSPFFQHLPQMTQQMTKAPNTCDRMYS